MISSLLNSLQSCSKTFRKVQVDFILDSNRSVGTYGRDPSASSHEALIRVWQKIRLKVGREVPVKEEDQER